MTYDEVLNIASRLSKETKKRIDKDVDERMEILRQGDLSEEDMAKMEECLYMSLVIQEYLDSEFELLEEEKALLLDEMEELYNEYGELLTRAKLEEKLSKKKRMALELMRIREQLYGRKDLLKNVNENLKNNVKSKEKLSDLSSKKTMKEVAKDSKKDTPKLKVGRGVMDKDTIKPEKEMAKMKEKNNIQESEIKKEQPEVKKKEPERNQQKVKNTTSTKVQKVNDDLISAMEETKVHEGKLPVEERADEITNLANMIL